MPEVLETLSQGCCHAHRVAFVQGRRDGPHQAQIRVVCDRGDTAAVLLYSASRGTVVLTRQMRLPIIFRGQDDGAIIEVAGGRIEDEDPAAAACREVAEETGYHVSHVQDAMCVFLNPAVLTERTHLFMAPIDETEGAERPAQVPTDEDEDVEVVELPFARAMAMVASGAIADAKTILLLYHAAMSYVLPNGRLEEG